jgi:adenosine kinase
VKRILVCGSIAYDNIMVFRGRFKDHILADQIHILNVAFLVPDLRREFGGCAGNIAYGLKLLGGDPSSWARWARTPRPTSSGSTRSASRATACV